MNVFHIVFYSIFFILIGLPFSRNASLSIYEHMKYKRASTSNIQGLYSTDDDLVILTKSNLDSSITKKPYAWVIEFYNSWCGFCQRFAPSWKLLGADIVEWSDMVKIGVVDCSLEENFSVCREYEIMAYPTVRYFHENYEPGENNLGKPVEKSPRMDYNEHRQFIINIMVEEQLNNRGQMYPNLLPYNKTDITNVFESLPEEIHHVFLIVEEPTSYLGKEVALDLHKISNSVIRSVHKNFTALTDKLGVVNTPAVVAFRLRTKTPQILPNVNGTRQGIADAIKTFLLNHHSRFTITHHDHSTHKHASTLLKEKHQNALRQRIKTMGDVVFQGDLETTIRYALREISRSKTITGEKLIALNDFIDIIDKYFPFSDQGKEFIRNLKNNLEGKTEIFGEEIENALNDAEKPESQVFTTPSQWLGCLGSLSTFRGYPCGLWKLFHYFTVNAYDDNEVANKRQVLKAMHGYVKNFFGCSHCSRHFQEMAARRGLFNDTSANEVLWLWEAHNEVNERLHGDPTEDPEYEKIIFPSAEHCPRCRRRDGKWENSEVESYLKGMYSRTNVKYLDPDTEVHHMVPEGDNATSGSSSMFHTIDISMFFALYVVSFILLLLLIRVFLKKGYRKKPYVHDLLGKV